MSRHMTGTSLASVRGQARYHAEKDHAGAGAAQGLVRGGRDDVAVLEGLRGLLRCHQAAAPRTEIFTPHLRSVCSQRLEPWASMCRYHDLQSASYTSLHGTQQVMPQRMSHYSMGHVSLQKCVLSEGGASSCQQPSGARLMWAMSDISSAPTFCAIWYRRL